MHQKWRNSAARKACVPAALGLAALSLAALLAACQQAPAPTASESAATATTAAAAEEANGPDAKPGMSAGEGKLILPVVAGSPAVAYFSLRNMAAAAATLSAIDIAGAGKAEMHKTEGGKMEAVHEIKLEPGARIAFAPGGLHVMVFDVSNTLKSGGTTEMTLTFSDGDKLSFPLAIATMGSSAGASAGSSPGASVGASAAASPGASENAAADDPAMAGHDMSGMRH